MPIFKPFRGIRPQDDYFEIFPTYPFDNFTEEEIIEKTQYENSYAQMVKPYLFSKSKDLDRTLRKIRHNYEELLEKNILTQDQSSFYLYEQKHPNGDVFRGLLGLTSLEDFWDGKIKRHESTIPQKKEKFSKYLEKVNLQSDPILLTYPSNSKIEILMDLEQKNIPIIRYTDEKGVNHKIWKIDNRLKMKQLKDTIENSVENFYIADGHHRIGSTALNAKRMQEKNKKHTGNEPYNFVYSFIVSNHSIKINDHNRIIKKLEGMSKAEFLKELEKTFLIDKKGKTPYYPSKKSHISMYMDGEYYSLHLNKEKVSEEDNIDQDHQLLDKLVFKNILKIEDTDSSDNIKYVKGDSSKQGIIKMQKIIDDNHYYVGFGVYPISFKELMQISNEKMIMPPKCTHIEPKLITALLMYDMK